MKHIVLYRAIALEHVNDPISGEPVLWVGSPIGRWSGYLSRSSAADAGHASGVKFAVVKSLPVIFPVPMVVEQAQRIEELEQRLATVTPIRAAAAS